MKSKLTPRKRFNLVERIFPTPIKNKPSPIPVAKR